MKTLAALLAAGAVLWAPVRSSRSARGDTNTIEHAAGAEKDLTSRACRKAGRSTNGLTHAPDALAGALPPIQLVLHGLIHPLHITQLRLGSTHLTLEP
jgi:hypothetical protein